jgi:hypothetical protein
VEAALISVLGAICVALISWLATRQSSKRLQQEHHDEQARLRLDAAMRAGALLSATEASPSPAASIASGLLALTNLGHADLAVALLVDLWSVDRPKVANEVAVLVIDGALKSTSPTAQLVAAELLCRNADRLDACQSLHWPSAIDGVWNPEFGPKTKVLLFEALMRMTLAREVRPGALRSVAVRLYGVWKNDPDERIRGCVGMIIGAVVPSLKRLGYSDFIQGNQKVMLPALEEAARTATENPDTFMNDIVEKSRNQLVEWANKCGPVHRDNIGLAAAV